MLSVHGSSVLNVITAKIIGAHFVLNEKWLYNFPLNYYFWGVGNGSVHLFLILTRFMVSVG
jgi:hypothetical protein